MSQGVPYEPNEEQRRTVRAMSGYGVPHDDIATMLRVDPKTLRKHFRDELDRGSIEATAKVGQSLFRMATEGGSVAAAIFWMKARAGWSERRRIEVASETDPSQMSDEQLMRIIVTLQDETAEDTDAWRRRFAEEDAAKAAGGAALVPALPREG